MCIVAYLHAWYSPNCMLVHVADMMVTTAPTANNVMVMAELVGETKQGLAMFFFREFFRQAAHSTAWRPCINDTLSIEHVEEIFTSRVSELIDVSAVTSEMVDARVSCASSQR